MLKLLKHSQLLSAQCRSILRNDLNQAPAQYGILMKKFHNNNNSLHSKMDDDSKSTANHPNPSPAIASKYERFTDEKATIILDIEEERDKMLAGEMETEEIEETTPSIFDGLKTESKSINMGYANFFLLISKFKMKTLKFI